MNKTIKNPTFFVDIDGTLVQYRKFNELSTSVLTPIQEVIDVVNKYYDEGAIIVITTARPSSYELFTKQELEKIGVKYHQLVMDLGRGTRVILNDKDPENEQIPRALGINLNRNQGWEGLDITEMVNSYEV
jgi:hydroxymethylpyrimidine pyrophosphatase-like HAD family hydrolase